MLRVSGKIVSNFWKKIPLRRCFRLDSKQSAIDFQKRRFDVCLRMAHLPNLAIQDRGRVGHRLRNEFAAGGL